MRHLCAWVLLSTLILAGCKAPSDTPASPVAVPSSASPAASPETSPTPEESSSPLASESPSSPAPSPARKPRRPRLKASVLSTSENGLSDASSFQKGTGKLYLRSSAEAIEPGSKLVAQMSDGETSIEDSLTTDRDTRTVQFAFEPPGDGWTAGNWRLTVSMGDENLVERQVTFGDTTAKKYKKPRFARLTDDLNSNEKEFTFSAARNKDIFLIVDTDQLKPGTPVRSVFIASEAENLDANELVGESTTKAPGPGRAALFVYSAPPSGFHPGTYQVDIYFEGEKVDSQQFWIKRR